MNKKKKIIIISSSIILILCLTLIIILLANSGKNNQISNTEVSKLKELPLPEITGGARGELGIDKNINESTIDEYLGREDSVYRDMRMLEDPGDYEKIGGDRFLSGYIEGFEVIPLPYILPVTGLPSEVGDTYTGTTLFYEEDGTYIANYEESMEIIEKIFPKDKVIFLMCGGGGYAGMTKNFLVSLGWDENKIYNTGGYWYYKGEHSVQVKKEVDGEVTYDFDNVPYHEIEFKKLTKSENYKEPEIRVTEIKINKSKLELEQGETYKLEVTILPEEATNKDVEWTSDNKDVATVTKDGLVKAIGTGNATITAKSTNKNKTVTCEVVVKEETKVTELKINTSKLELEEGTSFKLSVIVLPNEAKNKKVKWTSSNNDVASVDADGLVTAIGAGEATITVKSVDGNKTVTCNVIINKRDVSGRIRLDDVSKEAKEFDKYDLSEIEREYWEKTELKLDSNGKIIPNEYNVYDGMGYTMSDLGREEFDKYQEKQEKAKIKRLEIFNQLIESKKTFILLIRTKDCEGSPFPVYERS